MSDRSALKPIKSPQGEADKCPINSIYFEPPASPWCGRGVSLFGHFNPFPGELKATSLLFKFLPFIASEEGSEPPGDFVSETLAAGTIAGVGAA